MSEAAETGMSGTETRAEKVSLEQVLRVAELAQLELTTDEQSAMQRDLNSILGYVAQLNELDTMDVPPMAQVGEVLQGSVDCGQGAGVSALREDSLRSSLGRKEVMREAPETDGIYFKVPKVIER